MKVSRFLATAGLVAAVALCGSSLSPRQAAAQSGDFDFQSFESLGEMRSWLKVNFAIGSPRGELRAELVGHGRATLIIHPASRSTEKYLYDVNLCGHYVWRWNISADFDQSDRLRQLYLNGEIIFDGAPLSPFTYERFNAARNKQAGPESAMFEGSRPRPEAKKGESTLKFTLFDGDVATTGPSDLWIIGGGPSRPNPMRYGKMHVYASVEYWRSIFDQDDAATIFPTKLDCELVDESVARRRRGRK